MFGSTRVFYDWVKGEEWARVHELTHVNHHFYPAYLAFKENAESYEGKCMSKAKAECYANVIQAEMRETYYQQAYATGAEWDCHDYGADDPPRSVCVDAVIQLGIYEAHLLQMQQALVNNLHDMRPFWITLGFAFCLSIVCGTSGQTNSAESGPSVDSTVVIVGERAWSARELSEIALTYLKTKVNVPPKFFVRVAITPSDKKTMCEVSFQQGFDKECWDVKIGYDGNAMSWSTSVAREGRPKYPAPSK